MVSCKLLLSLLALVAVAQAIIRPGYGYGYGGGGGKNHPKTKKPTPAPTTTPVPVESTTLKMTPACEPGYTLYKRGSGYWCMKVVRGVNVTVSEAAALCTAERSVLTNYENEAERLAVSAQAQALIIGELGLSAGSIAVAGQRIKQCVSVDSAVISAPPCNDKALVFSVPASANTNPAYLWTTWAVDEPTSNHWLSDVEECLQLNIQPSDKERHQLVNDIYCNFKNAPNDPENTLYMNYGALCGQPNTFEASA